MAARVLVVDDERNIREALAKILGKQGDEVATADSGDSALALLQESVPWLLGRRGPSE